MGNTMKRLTRKSSDKMLAGVCSGIAEYFEIDVSVVRLAWILFSCFGAGIVAYIIAAIVIPAE